MRKSVSGAVVTAAVLALTGGGSAHAAQCSVGKLAELPVTMDRGHPMVDVKIDGTPIRLMADSGAFFSLITPGSAQSLHLRLQPAPAGFQIRGINGTASASIAVAQTFSLAGIDIPRVQFLVGGSEVGGGGVIGQNVFGVGDVEYDLPHGAIRLFKQQGCHAADLAYWAEGRSVSSLAIDARSPQNPHTIGKIMINGVPIRATFDTGAGTSILSMAAAARAGIRPDSPGVVPGGTIYGFGSRLVRTWIAPVQSLSIGDGETIRGAKIRFGELTNDVDMLLGADFFIAHRVYVDNKAHRLFLTYEGGPVFNLKARYDGPDKPAAVVAAETPVAGAAAPADAGALARDGAVAMARNDVDAAIGDYTRAIALAPAEPRYLEQRAAAYLRQNKRPLARADLERAIALKPDDAEARLLHAQLLVREAAWSAALTDLDMVDRTLDPAAMARYDLAGLLAWAGAPDRAVGVLDQWIKAHPADVHRPNALGERCWDRALAGHDLDAAIRDCDTALRAQKDPAFLVDRGFAYLRKGDWAKGIADFDAGLPKTSRRAWALYGRGIARQHAGDAAGGQADIDAALKIRPDIAADAVRYGIAPEVPPK